MIKRSPSRNSRSKGIKLKHVLQICLLLGVCFWLIYQVKHSHDKKEEFDEKEAKVSVRAQSGDEILKLGRKDLHPGIQDVTKSEKHEDDEEEETGVQEELNKEEETKHEHEQEEERGGGTKHEEEEREEEGKHEEEEREEEGKHEEEEQEEETKHTEDEGRGGGDDEIDERDQEKIEGEADPEEDFIDEEKEREEEGEEKETEGNEGEDNEAQVDDETPSEDQDHDGGDQNAREAREEHYKADDASSAVAHDTQIISTEPEKISSDNSNDNATTNDLELENNSKHNNTVNGSGDQNNSTVQPGQEMVENGPPLNVTAGEKKDEGSISTNSEDNKSILSNSEDDKSILSNSDGNTTLTSLSNDLPEPSNKSTEVSTEAGNNQIDGREETVESSQHNETLILSNSGQAKNAPVDGATSGEVTNVQTTESEQTNSSVLSDNRLSDSNSTIPSQTENASTIGSTYSNSSSTSQSDVSDRTIKPEVTAGADVYSGSSLTTKETLDATHNENSGTINESGGTDEGPPTTDGTENSVVHDDINSSDSSIGQEDKEVRIDPSTLPDTGTEGVNSENVAAE